ncbi:AP-3 complex subunit sigma [Purpureocillium lavendulum]|uniref:Transcription initiation factor TFIID subunit 13 n=1 Tax=Purpureocillium lavendulum TaxID=1247861 RepID=A0AB34FU86_9HYPO|nr:AP-3 complex subunit sigma [Purpureocillium lavendulum]
MEPRARAGKNVGKMNFSHMELAQLLYAHGDVKNPLPETVRVLDEILTDFMQSIAFEATRAAHYSGRQKIKYEDFEFAFRKNPAFLGKVQEVFEKQREIKKAREILKDTDDDIMKDAAEEEKRREKEGDKAGGGGSGGGGAGGRGTAAAAAGTAASAAARAEEELGEADDDAEAEADALGKKR